MKPPLLEFTMDLKMAPQNGIEPLLDEPKSPVLPLYDRGIMWVSGLTHKPHLMELKI